MEIAADGQLRRQERDAEAGGHECLHQFEFQVPSGWLWRDGAVGCCGPHWPCSASPRSPSRGPARADLAGVAFALRAAAGWAAYILLTQQVEDAVSGVTGLALSMPVAALCAGLVGAQQAAGQLSGTVLAQAAGLVLLLPILPYALEMAALRRLTTAAFGTLMALEPALAVLVGVVVLAQVPHALDVVGAALVMCAGLSALRRGARA